MTHPAPTPEPLTDLTPDRSADLFIAGGGMVGMTLGIVAARAGLSVVVADRELPATQLAPPFDGRASAIAYGTKRMLETAGIWPELAAEAEPILEIRVSEERSPLFLHYDHAELGDEPLGWMLENRFIRLGLHAVAAQTANLTVLAPAAVTAVERGPVFATATLADGRRVRAALVVAADGVRSSVREAAGIPVARHDYGQTAIVVTVEHELPHNNIAHEHFRAPGPFAILPLRGNRASLVWTEHTAVAPTLLALDDAQFNIELGRRFGDFLGAVKATGPRWSYPLRLSHARRYSDQRLVLAGDAAHGLHPLAGQNLNLGFRDVAALVELIVDARRLGRDIGDPDILADYEKWRRLDNTTLIAVTHSLNRLFSNDVAPVKLARGLGLAAVNRLPPLKKMLMQHARGTTGMLPRLLRGEAL